MAWTILVEDHQRNIFQNYIEIGPVVSDKIFKFFYIDIRGKQAMPPGGHVFWRIQMAWIILVEDHQRNISAKLYGNRASGFGQEDFYIFLYKYIGKISLSPPPPCRPCFLTNPNGSKNLGRGSPKEHFCKIIWKSVQWFLTRRFLKFSI